MSVPEAIQERFAHLIAAFMVKHNVPLDDVTALIMDVIAAYDDYLKDNDG